jgi:hypothetical protein
MSKNDKKSYRIILEPSIYEELDWDMDLIVSCLDILRNKVKLSFNLPATTTYDLFALTNFQGQMYPAIGLSDALDLGTSLDNHELNNKVDELIINVGLHNIRNEAVPGRPLTWTKLKEIGSYSAD